MRSSCLHDSNAAPSFGSNSSWCLRTITFAIEFSVARVDIPMAFFGTMGWSSYFERNEIIHWGAPCTKCESKWSRSRTEARTLEMEVCIFSFARNSSMQSRRLLIVGIEHGGCWWTSIQREVKHCNRTLSIVVLSSRAPTWVFVWLRTLRSVSLSVSVRAFRSNS